METIHFSHARTALKFGLKHLGLKEGDKILIPNYICDVLMHPLNELNIKPYFYNLDDGFNPDWIELKSLVKHNVRAVLMVNYFGQAQNIDLFKEFCSENNLFLVEDNAHGYGGEYNGQMLGTFGDIGIASPRKVLNIISGGILYLKDSELFEQTLKDYPIIWHQPIFKLMSKYFPSIKPSLKKFLKARPQYENPRSFREELLDDYFIDSYSLKELKNIDYKKVIKKRRASYKKWELFARDNKLKPVFKTLNSDANPWCLAAYTENSDESKKWFEWGWKKNYNIYSWPSLPEEIIQSDAMVLNRWKKLICFSTDNIPEV